MIIVGRKAKNHFMGYQDGLQSKNAVARLRMNEPGKFEMKYGQRSFRFLESAFLNAWYGAPGDLRKNDPYATAPKHTRGIEEWLMRKGLHEFAKWSLTPTALNMARAKKGKYVALSQKKGGWGGARTRSGRGSLPTDDLPDLFAECVEEAVRECSDAPYLRYESNWERVNRRKAPMRLFRKFREACNAGIGYGINASDSD